MDKKRLFGLLIASVILVSLVAGVASAQTAWEIISGPIFDFFEKWQAGDISNNLSKLIFTVLLTLIIYSVIDRLPFLKGRSNLFNSAIALIIAFLATAYFTPSDVYTILIAYGALGIVLGSAIPFLILIFFSYQIATDPETKAFGKIFVKIMWIGFIIFMAYKAIYGLVVEDVKILEMIAYLIFIGVAIMWVAVFEKLFVKWVTSEKSETYAESVQAAEANELITELREMQPQLEDKKAPGYAAAKVRYNAKVDRLTKLGYKGWKKQK